MQLMGHSFFQEKDDFPIKGIFLREQLNEKKNKLK